jgi:glycosyltransferase involved in cell wall biosynthesis
MTSRPHVSIIIRAFNEERHLGALLEVISRQSYKDYEIILVDSGSTDRTLSIAARYPVKLLHIKPEEFTFGRSLNLGLRAAAGGFAVLASAHVLPLHHDWLKNLIAPFEDPKVAIAYGKQRGGAGSKFSESQHFIRWFPDVSDFDQKRPYCNNANLALRHSVWEEQNFDETLTGLEDLAWASVQQERGYKIAYVAEAGVAHLHDETSDQIMNRHRREAITLKRLLPKSRFTIWHLASLYVRSVFTDCKAALKQNIFLREVSGIFSFRFLQYLGTFRGYRDPIDPSQSLTQVFYYPPGSLEKSHRPKVDSASSEIRHEAKV